MRRDATMRRDGCASAGTVNVRILTIGNRYPPHHLGGYELSCRDVMTRLAARGHTVTVLTTDVRVPGVEDPPGERAAGIHRDLRWYWADGALRRPPLRTCLAIERSNQRALARLLETVVPDVVSVWHCGGMSLGLLSTLAQRRLPVVYAVCDEWLTYGPAVDGWLSRWHGHPRRARVVQRLTGLPTALPDLGSSGAFCFVSEFIRRRAEEAGYRFAVSSVVYSGIDPVDFPIGGAAGEAAGEVAGKAAGEVAGEAAGEAAVEAAGPPRPWEWRLLAVGRIEPRKDLGTAIRALAQLPAQARLRIVGHDEGGHRGELERLAADLGLTDRVRFDAVPRAELAGSYRAADAVVFPSGWAEPFGLVPVEAMACGTPVVAARSGGAAEFLVDEVNCLAAPPGDPAALARALQRLAGTPALRERLAAGGRATARELSVDTLADIFAAWHEAAAGGFAHRPSDRPPLVALKSP